MYPFLKLRDCSSLFAIRYPAANHYPIFYSSCNSNSAQPKTTSVCLIGGDRFVSFALRAYLELFVQKSSDWQQYLRFSIITPGTWW